MPVIYAAGGGFALDRKGLHDSSPFVYSAASIPGSGEAFPLLIVADLVDSVPGAAGIVEDLIHGMAQYLSHTLGDDPQQALERAFATANQRVLAENQDRVGMRRMYVGLACVVMCGDEVYVAQCAPSQVLVWQDGHLHAIPDLSTWTAREITGTFSTISYPLGFRNEIRPRIAYSRCAQDDVIAVVSWQLARHLHSAGEFSETFSPAAFATALAELRTAGLSHQFHGAVFSIGHPVSRVEGAESRLSTGQGIDEWLDISDSGETTTAEHENPGQGHRRVGIDSAPIWSHSGGDRTADFDTLATVDISKGATDDLPIIRSHSYNSAEDAMFVNIASSRERFSVSGSNSPHAVPPGPGLQHNYEGAALPAQRVGRPPARRGHIVEIFAGLLLSLSAAVVGVWQVTKRDRPIHGPRDDGTLGLPHLQRWSDSYQRPRFERVRRVSPRFQINGFLLTGLFVAVAALAIVLVFNVIANRSENISSGLEGRLLDISAVRAQVDTSEASQSSYESLLSAQVALDELEASSPPEGLSEQIQEEQAAVAGALAELTSTEYLSNVQVMGTIPPAAEGVIPRLFKGGSRVFVLGQALYELDQVSGALIQLLAPGDLVGGEPVGPMLAASWNDDRPLVVDSHNAYMQDPADGLWHRVALGVLNVDGYSGVTAASAFTRNIYMLTASSGQILKFDALDFGVEPEDWAAGAAREQLLNAVDLSVDGSIHVALNDGQILTFFRSALERTLDAPILPPVQSVSAFTMVGEGAYFYMIDSADGRIVAINTEGEVARQFVTSPGLPSLAGATSLVVNESNGISYVIAGNTLFTIRLSIPGT